MKMQIAAAGLAALVLPALAVGLAAPATAQQMSRTDMVEIRRLCQSDLSQVCAGVTPGQGRILQCAAANEGRLSEPCRAALQKIREALPIQRQ